MSTLDKALENYILDEIEPEDNNHFSLNECDHPEVQSCITILNYVDVTFLIRQFGDSVEFTHQEQTVFIETWNIDYVVLDFYGYDFNIAHSSDLTTSHVPTDLENSPPTAEQVKDYAHKLSELITFINTHYLDMIDAMLAVRYTAGGSGGWLTTDELTKGLERSAEQGYINERNSGSLYGYPECCVAAFCDDLTDMNKLMDPERGARKLTGTGYIPCSTCNTAYSEEQLIERINQNRDTTLEPFHKNI